MQEEVPNIGAYDFMYGKFLLKAYFDIVMQEGDYIEHAYNSYKEIGNSNKSKYTYVGTVSDDRTIKLPCNLDSITSISTGADWSDVQGISWNDHYNHSRSMSSFMSGLGSNGINNHQQMLTTKARGEFVPYRLHREGDRLVATFTEEYVGQNIQIVYAGICVDSDGNPLLNRREAEAIAYRLALMVTQKKMFMGDPIATSLFQILDLKVGKKMQAAKLPDDVTENEWNRILAAAQSHNRKVYWSSYKG